MGSSSEPNFEPLFGDDPVVASAPGSEDSSPVPPPALESSFAPPPETDAIPEPMHEAMPEFSTPPQELSPDPEPLSSMQWEFPFHVRIEGPLAPHEKQKLLDLLGSDDFGVRPVDVEPQLDSGTVLLPRMSRYATAFLLQNLPLTVAVVKVLPVEQEFGMQPIAFAPVRPLKSDAAHPADDLPLTQADEFPQMPGAAIFDFASATLTVSIHETADAFERLKRKLRFVAHAKGASGVVRYRQETSSTLDAGFVRLTASGDLVRA